MTKRDWLKNFQNRVRQHRVLSALVFVGIVIIALATLTDAVGKLIQHGKDLFGSHPKASDETLEEWASRLRSHSNASPTRASTLASLTASDRKAVSVYQSFLGVLQITLNALRSKEQRQLYVDLPDFPTNAPLARVAYRGGVIFSRDASWSIFCRGTDQPGYAGPLFELAFMEGDGLSKGGAGVGVFSIQYQLEDDTVKLNATGVAAPMLRRFQRVYNSTTFLTLAQDMGKTLVEIEVALQFTP